MKKQGFWPPFYRRKGGGRGETKGSPPLSHLGGGERGQITPFFIILGPLFLLFSPYSALNAGWSGMGVNNPIFDFPRIYRIFLHLNMIFLAFIDPFWHLFAYFWSNHLGFH